MKSDGSQMTRLTDETGPDAFPTWSPDGKQILYAREGERPALWLMNSDGSQLLSIAPDAQYVGSADWLPAKRD